MSIDLNAIGQGALDILMKVLLKLLGAVLVWIVCRKLIGYVSSLITRSAHKQRVDSTVVTYIGSGVRVLLTLLLALGLLNFFGFDTTTFAALLAAAGIAIGVAWSGMLSNFAAGVSLISLRPFKLGDTITAGGVTGTVREIGLFSTTINSADNVVTFVGNGKIVGDNIQNYSANPFRRVDLVAQLGHGVDPAHAASLLREGLKQIPNVLEDPAPEIEILQFTFAGPVLTVRPFCSNDHYWQVYFDTNRLIHTAFTGAGFPVPEQLYAVRTGPAVQ